MIHEPLTAIMGEILSLDFSRVLFTKLNSSGIKSFSLRSLALGKLLREEVKSRSLHRAKGMQGPCTAFPLPSALLISLYLLFFLPIPLRGYCFIWSLLRHFYYLNHISRGNTQGPESLLGVISCLHSCWERICHLLKRWVWAFTGVYCCLLNSACPIYSPD